MDALEWATWVLAGGSLLAAAILGATALLARGALEDAKRTRHGQLVIELSGRWNSELIVKPLRLMGEVTDDEIVALVDKLYGPSGDASDEADLETFTTLAAVPELIEMIGVLASEGVISIAVINKMWRSRIVNTWEAWRPAAAKLRAHTMHPHNYEYFEWLAGQLKKLPASAIESNGDQAQARDPQDAEEQGHQNAQNQ